MTIVSNESRDSMKKILEALGGNKVALKSTNIKSDDDLVGPGQVSAKSIDAMAQIMGKLNNVTSQVMTESKFDPQLSEAMQTRKNNTGVKIGSYQISIMTDDTRIAGKQYYSIYHSQSGDVIADDLSLYEVALSVVKQLNNGKYVNSSSIRSLFEADDRYTSHRTDAIRFKRRATSAEKTGDHNKSGVFESRYQSSVNSVMQAKRDIKRLITESRSKI
jgi:hypothetical protein